MTEKDIPVALADLHTPVCECHVPAALVHRSARVCAEEVDEELLLAHDTVLATMRPESTELLIGP